MKTNTLEFPNQTIPRAQTSYIFLIELLVKMVYFLDKKKKQFAINHNDWKLDLPFELKYLVIEV